MRAIVSTSFLAPLDHAVGSVWATVTLLALFPHPARPAPPIKNAIAAAAIERFVERLLIEMAFIVILPRSSTNDAALIERNHTRQFWGRGRAYTCLFRV